MKMPYKINIKPSQTTPKWLTATLVTIYVAVAAFVLLNS